MRLWRLGAVALGMMFASATACSASVATSDDLARACVMFDACGMSTTGQTGSCVAQMQRWSVTHDLSDLLPDRELVRRIDCGRTATSCDALWRCISRDRWPDYCHAHPGASCDGTTAVNCSDNGTEANASDCADYGMTCAQSGGYAGCVTERSCDASAPARCEGNRWVVCDSALGRESSYDCSAFAPGSTCGTLTFDGRATVDCIPPGPACTTRGARCDGDVLVDCQPALTLLLGTGSAELVERRYDCAAVFGGHCDASSGSAVCAPQGNECTEDSPDRCDGTRVEVCVNGAFRATECASLGFRTCGANAGGHGVGCVN